VPTLGRIVVSWLVNAVALWVADWLFDGVRIDGWGHLLIAAAVFGVINALLKPALVVLSIPLILLTLGVFLLLINIALLGLTDWISGNGFNIDGFWTYVGTVIVIWLVNSVLDRVVKLD
jgi:putative membrane protein